jgi:carboxyl-terminal processing protease
MGAIFRRQSDALLVKKIYDGSAAAQAGLKKGDRVLAINGLFVKSLMPSKTNELIKMKNEKLLLLQVQRGNQTLQLELNKSEKSFPALKSQVIHRQQNQVGLLTIHKFSKEICKEVKKEIIHLQQESIAGLILDLRDNPGGQVDEAACVINLFVPRGKWMFETRYLNEDRFPDKYIATEKPIYNGPLVVLINSGSASAAEIVAGSLKDLQRATLVGERTFGKGTFQDGSIWNANPKIALFQTGGFYYFPSGWTPQLMGLQPDIKVSFANTESLREEDQFFFPVIPTEIAFNPNSLNWVLEKPCSADVDFFSDAVVLSEDPQLMQAQSWLECGVSYVRNSGI